MDLDRQYKLSDIYADIHDECVYISVSYHRNGNPKKSQWSISIEEEFESFKTSRLQNWTSNKRGWGLHPSKPNFEVGTLSNEEVVFIARFQEMSPDGQPIKDIWHGYPADIRNKKNDIPTDAILKCWLENSYINKSQFSRIRRGVL